MTIEALISSLNCATTLNIPNALLTFARAVLVRFRSVEQHQDNETASIKEMISRLEDRLTTSMSDLHAHTLKQICEARIQHQHEIDILAVALDSHKAGQPTSRAN